MKANITSDHYPLILQTKFKLKANYRRKKIKKARKFKPIEEQWRYTNYNTCFETLLGENKFKEEEPNYEIFQETLQTIADYYIRDYGTKVEQAKAECSDETEQLYQLRETAINADLSNEKIHYITKKIRICRRIDKMLDSIESLDKDLDLKDKWLGIKKLKKNYTPQPYVKKDERGIPIPRHKIADFSAKQLKKLFWTCDTPSGGLKHRAYNTGRQHIL